MIKKANAILEYGIVLIIAVSFLMGIHMFLRRHIEGRVKDESDRTIGHAFGLEWPEQTYTIGGSRVSFDRYDEVGGSVNRRASKNDWSVTYTQPIGTRIMKHKRASMHTQDAAKSPPSVSYPSTKYVEWDDQPWRTPEEGSVGG